MMPRTPTKTDSVEPADAPEVDENEAAAITEAAPAEAAVGAPVEPPAVEDEPVNDTGIHPDIQALLDKGYNHKQLEVRTGTGGFISVRVIGQN